MLLLLYLPALAVLLLIYFRVADKFNIIDKPNHRSSHKKNTTRGGGIVFPLALFSHFSISGFKYPYFMLGLLIVSLISFADDVKPISNKTRIVCHLAGVSLLFYQTNVFSNPLWVVLMVYIIVIGTINAYNFMDGINGITGGYSLVVVSSLYFVNQLTGYIDQTWILTTLLALLVFNFFNFRKRAVCFAGDVGSVSIAFVILFFLGLLIIKSGELKYIGFLLLYGLDSVSTIIFRLLRKENIFEAHRSHFYQYLANNLRWSHLLVSILYMIIQLILNVLIIYVTINTIQSVTICLLLGILFLGLRYTVEGKDILVGKVGRTLTN